MIRSQQWDPVDITMSVGILNPERGHSVNRDILIGDRLYNLYLVLDEVRRLASCKDRPTGDIESALVSIRAMLLETGPNDSLDREEAKYLLESGHGVYDFGNQIQLEHKYEEYLYIATRGEDCKAYPSFDTMWDAENAEPRCWQIASTYDFDMSPLDLELRLFGKSAEDDERGNLDDEDTDLIRRLNASQRMRAMKRGTPAT